MTDKLATKIADRLVDKLGLRLAKTIAQRIVYHQRMASRFKFATLGVSTTTAILLKIPAPPRR